MPTGFDDKRLLTQQEVAVVLRRSVRSVARLRRMGELAWLPGAPVMIPAAELDAYLERKMVARRAKTEKQAPSQPLQPLARRASRRLSENMTVDELRFVLRHTKGVGDKMSK